MLLYKNTFTLLLFHAFIFSFICIKTLLFFCIYEYLNVNTFTFSYFYTFILLLNYSFIRPYFYDFVLKHLSIIHFVFSHKSMFI